MNRVLERTDFLVVGCGPARATAAREAARNSIPSVVLERDPVVGQKRVCAAGLRPGVCRTFDLPSSLVHCDTPRLALFDAAGNEHEIFFGPGHTTTREELDATMASFAVSEGADVRTSALFRSIRRDGDRYVVEYADLAVGVRRRHGLMTTLQYRVYLDRRAASIAYQTLELHYYRELSGRTIIGWC
jgi:flavin-dependent dehydrogenase